MSQNWVSVIFRLKPMLREPLAMVALNMYHLSTSTLWQWHCMKCKSHRLHESCATALPTAGRGVKRWHTFPRAVFNLTWNLNQEGRSLMIPWRPQLCACHSRGPRGLLPSVGGAGHTCFELLRIYTGFQCSVTHKDMISCPIICSAFVVLLSGVAKWW